MLDEALLRRAGWTDVQASALLQLILEAAPDGLLWGPDGRRSTWRQDRLWAYCSSHGKQDPTSLHGQLNAIEHDLRNNMNRLYSLACDTHDKKRSIADAKAALQPYFSRLKEGMCS